MLDNEKLQADANEMAKQIARELMAEQAKLFQDEMKKMQDEMSKMKKELSKKVDDAISGKMIQVTRMKQTKMPLVILEPVSKLMEREYIQT